MVPFILLHSASATLARNVLCESMAANQPPAGRPVRLLN